ncbi:MAG: bifunctional hydroxymethylpyrimidine kinase/phosphomethylpyrimidine kinase [Ruminococcaceae bacterium]|nr:bifunctional hydroxymethylpyrimidine kinase/phosphomethylpyrimidine kinase [Oscillospiraceae bacterium]
MKTVLSIAGSDSCGGAGIQADIKTMTMNGVYAMSAITALTAQNTVGVEGIILTAPGFLEAQINAVFRDIRPDAVKTGMTGSAELTEVIAGRLRFYKAENIVVDPVMVATSGSRLMEPDAAEALKKELLPLARLVTPNIPEAQVLSGIAIRTKRDMEYAAKAMGESFGCAVLLKGGHSINDANDLLYDGGSLRWFCAERIENPNTHGTGCTLSSAIASNLAKGYSLEASVERAKEYISGALGAMLDLGQGSGPMNHMFDISGRFFE